MAFKKTNRPHNKKIGQIIKSYRRGLKKSQMEFAYDVGVSTQYICYLENGRIEFSMDNLILFSKMMYPEIKDTLAGVIKLLENANSYQIS